VVLDQLANEAERLGDAGIREWTELATLDAIDLGEQLGLLSDVAAAGRRAAVRPGDQDQRSAVGRRLPDSRQRGNRTSSLSWRPSLGLAPLNWPRWPRRDSRQRGQGHCHF
jgi:hypothetical protein